MKPSFWTLAFLIIFVPPAACALPTSQASETVFSSDIFLLTIDTFRADHVGCYGDSSIRTPALDGLAADGIRFSNAFTASPITNASHATILTGLLPAHHGVRDFGWGLDPGVKTLAEALKGRGYSTAAFIGAVILDSRGLAPGFDRGFDYYDHFPEQLAPTASRYVRLERRAMDVEQRAENWILSRPKAAPAFAWIHFYDPHDPYDPPEPYRTQYANRLYDGEIAYADSALGRFITFLKQQNLYETSTILVVGDHGEGLGEHGEETHGIFLYDSTLHVPLILKLHRSISTRRAGMVVRGIVVNAQARTVDLAPTILELEGIHELKPLDGTSLRPLWEPPAAQAEGTAGSAPAAAERVVFGETDYPLDFGFAPLRSVRADGKKYIEAPRPELYDLRGDPGETHNRYEPWDADVQRLRGLEAEFRKRASPSGATAAVGAAKIDELRALGYLGTNPGSTTAPEPSLLPDPKEKVQLFNLIHTAMLDGEDRKPEEARSSLERALEIDPKSAAALSELGRLELDQGNYRRAADLLSRALAIRPQDSTSAYGEARARYALGDLHGARARLESSEDLLAGNYEALCLLGKVDAESKNWAKAEDPLEAAVILDSSRPEAYVELARVYLAENKPAEALRQLDEARRLAPDSSEVRELRAQAQRLEHAGKSSGQAPTRQERN
jgi:arylsulfatase A-like enzyme/Tfp pilus assembly protein PilF